MFELLNRELFGTTVLNWLLAIAAALAVTALVALAESKLAQQQEEAKQRFRDVLTNMVRHTRKQLEESSAAASESWATLQGGVRESFETLRSSVNQAVERIAKD